MSVSISRLVEPCLARRFFRRASSAPACFLKMSPNTTAATGQPSKWGMSVVMMAFQKSNIPEVYRLASTRHVEQAQPGQSTRRQHPCWLQCYAATLQSYAATWEAALQGCPGHPFHSNPATCFGRFPPIGQESISQLPKMPIHRQVECAGLFLHTDHQSPLVNIGLS